MSTRPETLEAISIRLGLHPKTLYEYRRKYAETFPDPAFAIGNVKAYYFADIVEWHATIKRGER